MQSLRIEMVIDIFRFLCSFILFSQYTKIRFISICFFFSDFSTGDSEGDSYNKIAVGLVVLLVLCIGIYYFYLADKS